MDTNAVVTPSQDPAQILAGLNAEQRAVATSFGAPVVVLAGAGTGKTRAITHRIAYGVTTGVQQANASLAVTFTQRAAGELRERLANLGVHGVQARTFHSAALRQLRYFWPQAYAEPLPEVLGRNLGLVAAAARKQGLGDEPGRLRDLASEISWAKVSNVGPEDYLDLAVSHGRAVSGLDVEQVARVMHSYEQIKRSREVIDYDDILLCNVALLHQFPAIAERIRQTYRHFTVDEFQDLSPLQWSLLQAWVDGRPDLCVVGDPLQAIHGFAGADPKFLLELTEASGNTVLELTQNYRSSPQILHAANAIVSLPHLQAGMGARGLRTNRTAGPKAVLVASDDEQSEAQQVAEWLTELHTKHDVAWQQMAVLYRVHARSAAFEAALADRQIPYQVRDAEGFFERGEIRRALVEFQKQNDDDDQQAASIMATVKQLVSTLGWSQQPPEAVGQQRQIWESLDVLVGLVGQLLDDGATSWSAINAQLATRAAQQQAPLGSGVTLTTMHAAKGLEWQAVAVTGVQEGGLPFVLADSPAELDEERRLLYVAMTRPKQWLRISWNASRTAGKAGRSRFLAPLFQPSLSAHLDISAVSSTAPNRSAKKPARKQIGNCFVCGEMLIDAADRKLGHHSYCPAELDESLFAQLRAWRLQAAAEASAPAFVIFTDATLQAIAERKPTDEVELLQVPGVGRVKMERYGRQVLEILRANDVTD